MPRKTKAERERIKVTCLWCENEARTHLICAACMAPMSENERKQYVRVLPIDGPGDHRKAKRMRDNAKWKERVAAWVKAGACRRCGGTDMKSARFCKKCAIKISLNNGDQYERRKKEGQCVSCVRQARPGKTQCAECAAITTEESRARKQP